MVDRVDADHRAEAAVLEREPLASVGADETDALCQPALTCNLVPLGNAGLVDVDTDDPAARRRSREQRRPTGTARHLKQSARLAKFQSAAEHTLLVGSKPRALTNVLAVGLATYRRVQFLRESPVVAS